MKRKKNPTSLGQSFDGIAIAEEIDLEALPNQQDSLSEEMARIAIIIFYSFLRQAAEQNYGCKDLSINVDANAISTIEQSGLRIEIYADDETNQPLAHKIFLDLKNLSTQGSELFGVAFDEQNRVIWVEDIRLLFELLKRFSEEKNLLMNEELQECILFDLKELDTIKPDIKSLWDTSSPYLVNAFPLSGCPSGACSDANVARYIFASQHNLPLYSYSLDMLHTVVDTYERLRAGIKSSARAGKMFWLN